ncbi:unnamed protein product, partial [Menidia menidia]
SQSDKQSVTDVKISWRDDKNSPTHLPELTQESATNQTGLINRLIIPSLQVSEHQSFVSFPPNFLKPPHLKVTQ